MAKEKAPAMQFYGREFYADENVLVMTLEQEAAYLRLLWNCWQEGSIPGEVAKLAAICKNTHEKRFKKSIWPALAPCFVRSSDGRFINRKVEEIRQERAAFVEKCSVAGKRGAAAKRHKQQAQNERVPSRVPLGNPCATLQEPLRVKQPLQSPVSSLQTPPVPPALWAAFERLIERYPNRVEVDYAAQMWLSLVDAGTVTEATVPEIEAGLTRWMESDQWTRDDGRYVPSPVKWLRDKRWLDHPPANPEVRAAKRGVKRSSDGVDPDAEWVAPWRRDEVA